MTLIRSLTEVFHPVSPFDGFDATEYPVDLQGWFDAATVLNQMIDTLQPRVIVEVGTWKGTSAVHMIERARRWVDDVVILCVDTWLGSAEHFFVPVWRDLLKPKHGYPQIYYQFLANIVHLELTEHVVPVPLTSRGAAQMVASINLHPPLVYIDGAHDEASVRDDIADWWPLVIPGGAMVGDDYSTDWPGLMTAVDAFFAEADDIEMSDTGMGKWYAQKKRG